MAFLLANIMASVVVFTTYGTGDDDVLTPIWVIGISGLSMWTTYLVVVSAISRRYGSGDVVTDYRIRFAWGDLWGIPLGIASQFLLVTAVTYPLTKLFPDQFSAEEVEKRARELADAASGGWVVVLFLVVVIGAPVVEEIVYRGLLQQGLERSINPKIALVVTAAIFAAIHLQPIEFPGLFAFALVLGWAYHKTQRLGLPIIAHMAFNACGLLVVTVM
jgi:membrane protease YdiL (CAAX protease family)